MCTVSGDQETPLTYRVKHVPIVVVPGIMGTRLSDADHHLMWNPKSARLHGRSPGDFAARCARLMQLSHPLYPDEWNTEGYDADRARRARYIPNFFHCIPDFYDDLCFTLREDLAHELHDRHIRPRVYCSGYDWRTDNYYGAVLLKRVLEAAVAECDGEPAIIVAHSMGGLVSRYYCHVLGGARFVRALFLLGSPSLGATQPYALLKRGIIESDDRDLFGLRLAVMALDQGGSRNFVRAMASMYQLLPNRQFARADPHWLHYDTTQSGYPYAHTPGALDARTTLGSCGTAGYDIYRDMFAGFAERAASRDTYNRYVQAADDFHGRLQVGDRAYMHPETRAIVCGNMDTTVRATLSSYGGVEAQGGVNEYVPSTMARLTGLGDAEAPLALESGRGDTKVPELSSTPGPELLTHPLRNTDYVLDVAHGDLPNDPDVRRLLVQRIQELHFTEARVAPRAS